MWSGNAAAAIARWRRRSGSIPASVTATIGWCYYLLGRYADAVAMLNRGMPSERSPSARNQISPFSPPPTPNWATPRRRRGRRRTSRRSRRSSTAAFFISQFTSETDRAQLRDGLAKAGIGG